MKILVTGVSGFIGSTIVEVLAANDQNQIWATGRSHTTRFHPFANVTYFQQDLSEPIPDQNCDVCIHCAGLADDKATWAEFERHNITATKNLIGVLRNCKLFIYVSSSSVYDFSDGKIKYETDASLDKDLTRYGRSKLLAEDVVRSSTIESVYILRPRAVYGAGDRVLLPRILGLIRWGRMILPATISSKASMTHILNFTEVVSKSIERATPGVHVFNVADKKIYGLKSIFGEILQRKSGKRTFVWIPGPLVKFLSFLSSFLGSPQKLSKQSLRYITEDSVLGLEKAENLLGYTGQYEFYGSVDQLDI